MTKANNKNSTKMQKKIPKPTGIVALDSLADISDEDCSLDVYLKAVSEYVRRAGELNLGAKKAGQIRLSNALGRALVRDLRKSLPKLKDIVCGEAKVAGALRTVNADVSQMHRLDGLRLAVEIKPINLAVGRAIWNRFGDIRTFAVNLHLKFPFCVVGGVLVIPTYEIKELKDLEAEAINAEAEVSEEELLDEDSAEGAEIKGDMSDVPADANVQKKSTLHLISKAVNRLVRAGGRETEGDAAHLLEGIAVIVFDPDSGTLDAGIPTPESGLRWNDFINTLATTYKSRFED